MKKRQVKDCKILPRLKVVSIPVEYVHTLETRWKVSTRYGIQMEDNIQFSTHQRDFIPWGIRRIGAPNVWGISQGNRVKVAVIDTGIDANHPDLKDRVKESVSFVSGSGDQNGHGTHVAGTIGASLNHLGIAGAAPEVELYAVKSFQSDGSAFLSDILEGIEWSIQHNMQVMNMSFGTPDPSNILEFGVAEARNAGIILVASAGNSGGDAEYPAKYPGVIGIGATTKSNQIASFSSRGEGVNFYAPGVSILSTWLDGTYRNLSGTSMSCAHVTGAVALLKGYNSSYTLSQILNLLEKGSSPLKGGGFLVDLTRLKSG
ncbi:S8 family peptidase [Microaerobacter geothermalis]|uniref:S8 family peptidase n=1 Tax=Microaerobacter geothermalis TaxID=674972 RepID=UPI001F46BF93|nr:S8 family peptidase [Microaerobacter geothermalis]